MDKEKVWCFHQVHGKLYVLGLIGWRGTADTDEVSP